MVKSSPCACYQQYEIDLHYMRKQPLNVIKPSQLSRGSERNSNTKICLQLRRVGLTDDLISINIMKMLPFISKQRNLYKILTRGPQRNSNTKPCQQLNHVAITNNPKSAYIMRMQPLSQRDAK